MSLTNLLNVSPSALTSQLRSAVTSDVGALVNNASKYGTNLATDWARSSGLGEFTNLKSITGTLTSSLPSDIAGLPTAISGLSTNLTGLANNIQNLDVLGKASQFATEFANPLTNLSNLGNFNLNSLPSIGSLTSAFPSVTSLTSGLTAGLPSIGSLTSAIPNLSSLTAGLPNLTNLAGLGNFSSLLNLGSVGALGGALGGLFGGGGDSLVSATKVAAGYTNTVDRSVVDSAFVRVVGDAKIPLPLFNFPSADSTSLGASADITAAQNFLQNLRTQGNQIGSQAQNIGGVFGVSGGGFGGFLNG
jgi:hypothetical protein